MFAVHDPPGDLAVFRINVGQARHRFQLAAERLVLQLAVFRVAELDRHVVHHLHGKLVFRIVAVFDALAVGGDFDQAAEFVVGAFLFQRQRTVLRHAGGALAPRVVGVGRDGGAVAFFDHPVEVVVPERRLLVAAGHFGQLAPTVVGVGFDFVVRVGHFRQPVEIVVFVLDRAIGLAVEFRVDLRQHPVFVVDVIGQLSGGGGFRVEAESAPVEFDLMPVLVQHFRQLPDGVVTVFHAGFVREELLHHPPESVAFELLHPARLIGVARRFAVAVVGDGKRVQNLFAVFAFQLHDQAGSVVGVLGFHAGNIDCRGRTVELVVLRPAAQAEGVGHRQRVAGVAVMDRNRVLSVVDPHRLRSGIVAVTGGLHRFARRVEAAYRGRILLLVVADRQHRFRRVAIRAPAADRVELTAGQASHGLPPFGP
ncbi:hypothetical protein SDC9_112024 [bioreactor metagenome]|uniref:Uncharacterized protein n=1 Tax=bioreactor metagenome TaxID=1076179 RepID=A0A645BIN1_9ZZZZ